MNNPFDELTKSVAQSVTRRGALKNFGFGLVGMALACFGLANKAQAGPPTRNKKCFKQCMSTCVSNLVAQGESEETAEFRCQPFCAFQCTTLP